MSSVRRIVSLLSSATEILCALGLGNQLVAVSHECDYPTSVANKPRATRSIVDSNQSSADIDRQVKSLLRERKSLYEIDRDLLRELRPDLIVTQSQCEVCAIHHAEVVDCVQSLPELHATQVVTLNPHSLEEVLADVQILGAVTQARLESERLVAEYRARIADVRRAAATSPAARPRVVCIEWIEPLMIAANWNPQLIEWAGGQTGLATAGERSRYVDWNALAEFDPQLIVVAPCGFDLSRTVREAAGLASHPAWQALSAVRNGRVYAVDGNVYFNRSGPRLVDSLELMAHLIQPQRIIAPQSLTSPELAFCSLGTVVA